ncbi:hypothetical protein KC19_2G266900 [Ceratodon purpureus]|uniref:Bicarbonate transporter-like transmembrane domain-containing protein n=1 Tax=Ceratodon purpureus TaxID=3225 RepID=A0A8T0J0N1_CERPU|nr:hypothetical protein KC19_2G266900 [Ceratodon purpureus]KAG0588759.1 hypothetical protein KC19_2G266900 [Ceratodon purpureus]KAG0588760.1 hypothetical protein KC19_2G266900 [Ceratodon purpureus]KAG0588761.1 hypothetical protein KC19_2G266900 [Ceratodon purpureus]KAG0588762.1 hypothetical protein KC19_2G266900 [Ceratodon purpureus]
MNSQAMEKLLGSGSTAFPNSPSAIQRQALSSLRTFQSGPLFHQKQGRCCRSLRQSSRVKCLTYSAHDGSWSSRRHTNNLGLEFPLRSRGSISGDDQQSVKCRAATAGADAFGSFGQPGDGAQGFGAGIAKDIERRLPHYFSDFTDGLHPKALSSVVYMIFASLAPCFAFGGMLSRVTASQMGLLETIISCAVSGLIYTSLAAQPLTLLGPTGFMVVITGALYRLTKQAMVPFFPVYGWVGIWSCLFLVGLGALEASSELVKYLTRFVDETFTTFISIGFMCEAYKGIASLYSPASPYPIETALLSFVLAAGTYATAKFLTQLRSSRLLLRPVAGVIADFGPPLAIFLMSMVPVRFFPTVPLPPMPAASKIAATAARPWLVPLFSVPPWVIAASAIPAVFVSLLIFLDQTMTSRLVNKFQSPSLQKGEGYNLDLAMVGVTTALASLFGLPWMVASAVPSLNHVRSLVVPAKTTSASGSEDMKKEEIRHRVLENRLTGIMISAGVGASLAFWPLLRRVPLPVTSGLFVFMSLGIINGSQFVERVKLWLYHPELTPEHEFTKQVPKHEVHKFTVLQLACLWALWNLKESKWGLAFPVVILALIPIRNILATRVFQSHHLAILDPK